MNCVTDEQVWFRAYMETPFSVPDDRVADAHSYNDPNRLLDVPGVCVKSKEREDRRILGLRMPKHHGKLVTYDEGADSVLIRGHGTPVSPKCVWTGTVSEYRRMWEVD